MKRIGKIALLTLLVVLALLGSVGWYVVSLPWRNSCQSDLPVPTGQRTNAAVATSQPVATQAARTMLERGGSAVDAAVAAALTLAVAEPGNSGLGGGGFALVHAPLEKRTIAFDFREQAPAALDVAALLQATRQDANALRNGALAVAVPSEWDGLVELHRRFGRLPLADVLSPAIAAAEQGIEVTAEYCARCFVRSRVLSKSPDAKKTFMTSLGVCPLPGWRLVQPELAKTLRALAAGQSFEDVVGRKMIAFLQPLGSKMSEADLRRPHVTERPPVRGVFKGHEIVSMGLPSSGGLIVISLLQAYQHMRALHPNANRHHLWIEASRLSFFDRARLFGDPDFVRVDSERIVSDAYSAAQAQRVAEAAPVLLPDAVPAAAEGDHTTHLSVVDSQGMAVAMTLTINVPFGSGLVVPGTGVLLNNEMDDFFVDRPNAFGLVGNEQNAPAPGKRPLSSMAPTFVFEGATLKLVLGSPGGSSIPSAVAQVIRNMLEDGASGDVAVRSGRIHHQWLPARVQVEPYFDRAVLPKDVQAIAEKPMFPIGRVQLVWLSDTGYRATCDCRDQGEPFQTLLAP